MVAGACWFAGLKREADNVASLARVPVGCSTTLDFERSGEFVVFVETTGRIEQLAGDCAAALVYDRPAADAAVIDRLSATMSMVDPDGVAVDIDASPGEHYDRDGFVGTAAWTVDVATPGVHVLTIAPIGGDSFAVAIGRPADDGVAAWRWGAGAAALAALAFGVPLLALGGRRNDPAEPMPRVGPPMAAPIAPSNRSGPWGPPGSGQRYQ